MCDVQRIFLVFSLQFFIYFEFFSNEIKGGIQGEKLIVSLI